MAQRMNANTKATEGAAQSGPSSYLAAVLSCMQKGTPAKFRIVNSADEVSSVNGFGEGYEFVANYNEIADGSVLFASLDTATAGAISNVDNTQVKGSSAASFTGTPYDDEQLQVKVADDGNQGNGTAVGTAGISIQYSRDGGLTWSRARRLGTATSYAIASVGVTVTFSAGTLKTGDLASCYCKSPKWDSTALTAAITALLARSDKPRAIMVCGDCPDRTTLQELIAQAAALRAGNRFTRLFFNLRDYLPKAVFQGSRTFTASLAAAIVSVNAAGKTYTRTTGSWLDDGFVNGDTVNWAGFVNAGNNGRHVITALTATVMTVAEVLVDEIDVGNTTCSTLGESLVAASATKKYTRTVGSWLTDGFAVGQTATITGFVNAGNNGPHVITAVTALDLTVAEVLVDELAPVFGVTASAQELDSTWTAALGGVVGDTLATELVDQGVSPYGGRGRRVSPTDGSNKRRPASWWALMRWMQHDPAVAPYRVSDGPLDGGNITIVDANGDPEDHDERTMGGLLDNRISCLESKDDRTGVFASLALTLDNDNAVLSRVQTAGVSDIISDVVQTATSNKLGSSPQTNKDGTLTEAAARAIEDYVRGEIEKKVLTKGPLDGLPQASSVDSVSISRSVNVLTPGALVPTVTKWTPLGVLEQIENTVQANSGS